MHASSFWFGYFRGMALAGGVGLVCAAIANCFVGSNDVVRFAGWWAAVFLWVGFVGSWVIDGIQEKPSNPS